MGTSENQTGVSRRDLLKKGAVAGGIVWTAPLVFSSPAGATDFGSPPVCDEYYIFRYNGNGASGNCEGGSGNACVQGTYQDGCTAVTSSASATATTVTITFTYNGAGTVQKVTGYQKGASALPCEPVEATKTGTNSFSLTFSRRMANGQDTSHYQVIFCVNTP